MKLRPWLNQTLALSTSLCGLAFTGTEIQAANIIPACDTSTTYSFITVYQNSSNGICPPAADWVKQVALEWRGGVVGSADYEFGYGENGADVPLAGSIYRDWTATDNNRFYNWALDYVKATQTFTLNLQYAPGETYTETYTTNTGLDLVDSLAIMAKVNDVAAGYTSYLSVDRVFALDGRVADNGSSPLAVAQFTGNNSSSADPTFTEISLLGHSGSEIQRAEGRFMMSWPQGAFSPSSGAFRSNITMNLKAFDPLNSIPESSATYPLLALLGLFGLRQGVKLLKNRNNV